MIQFHAYSAARIAGEQLPGPCAVLRMADDEGLLPKIADPARVLHQLDLTMADCEQDAGLAKAATTEQARRILAFWERADADHRVAHFVAQCQAGIGRSVAVCAALSRLRGDEPRFGLHRPTHNRTLYRLILEAGGGKPEAEPLVSIAVRLKYQARKLTGFLFSLQAQRYDNWEAVCFSDGPHESIVPLTDSWGLIDKRVRIVETPEPRGRWGHPWRQSALEQCRGEWIGTNNDDNYLTPGYIEQMMLAARTTGADVVLCQMLHRYNGWNLAANPGSDLCAWLAKADLVRATPWTGTGFTADQEYLAALTKNATVAVVHTPLVVKN